METGPSKDSSGCRTTTSGHECNSGTFGSRRFSDTTAFLDIRAGCAHGGKRDTSISARVARGAAGDDRAWRRADDSIRQGAPVGLLRVMARSGAGRHPRVFRFHPRGDIVNGSVLAPVHDRGAPDGIVIDYISQPLDVSVPLDATQIEV